MDMGNRSHKKQSNSDVYSLHDQREGWGTRTVQEYHEACKVLSHGRHHERAIFPSREDEQQVSQGRVHCEPVRSFRPDIAVSVSPRFHQLCKQAFGLTTRSARDGSSGPSWWRAYPSSGGLHPLESYWVFPASEVHVTSFVLPSSVVACMVHYDPVRDVFSLCASFSHKDGQRGRLETADWLSTFAICLLTIVPFRMTAKYRIRTFRYYALDTGHMLCSLAVSAFLNAQKWEMVDDANPMFQFALRAFSRVFPSTDLSSSVLEWERDRLAAVLVHKLVATSRQHVDRWGVGGGEATVPVAGAAQEEFYEAVHSRPMLLHHFHFSYQLVEALNDEVFSRVGSRARDSLQGLLFTLNHRLFCLAGRSKERLQWAVNHRRTARQIDPATSTMDMQTFRRIVSVFAVPARADSIACPCACYSSVVIMVHRVAGLSSGIYIIPRFQNGVTRERFRTFRKLLARKCPLWETVPECSLDSLNLSEIDDGNDEGGGRGGVQIRSSYEFELIRLVDGDCRDLSFACVGEQEHGWNGAFCLFFITDLSVCLPEPSDFTDSAGTVHGSSQVFYTHPHWECGAVGHGVYLASELCGYRANAMGYYHDELVHSSLGLQNSAFQCLYTMAVGRSTADAEARFAESSLL
eukprot:ANDGO_00127.mRNA.1 hypothetical protein